MTDPIYYIVMHCMKPLTFAVGVYKDILTANKAMAEFIYDHYKFSLDEEIGKPNLDKSKSVQFMLDLIENDDHGAYNIEVQTYQKTDGIFYFKEWLEWDVCNLYDLLVMLDKGKFGDLQIPDSFDE